MEINNIDQYRQNPRIIAGKAKNNYNNYKNVHDKIFGLAKADTMLTNIDDMKNRIKILKSAGPLDDEFSSMQLNSCLQQAINIQIKPDKSIKDISDFYSTYNNFINIYERLGGEYNV